MITIELLVGDQATFTHDDSNIISNLIKSIY